MLTSNWFIACTLLIAYLLFLFDNLLPFGSSYVIRTWSFLLWYGVKLNGCPLLVVVFDRCDLKIFYNGNLSFIFLKMFKNIISTLGVGKTLRKQIYTGRRKDSSQTKQVNCQQRLLIHETRSRKKNWQKFVKGLQLLQNLVNKLLKNKKELTSTSDANSSANNF